MKKCNNCQTVALNDADECCRECWEDKFTEIDELPETDEGSESAVKRLVINGFDTDLIMPKDKEPVLFLVDNDPEHKKLDTWFGYANDGRWWGVAEDNEGWQEMGGDVLRWIPFPELSL